MSTVITRTLGPYTEGEKPADLTVDFYPTTPPDLTGWTLGLTCERDGTAIASWGSIEWADAENAQATVTFPALTLATGQRHASYRVQCWAGNTVQKIATVYLCFYVHRAVGTVPSI